jgi:hypothetical protein
MAIFIGSCMRTNGPTPVFNTPSISKVFSYPLPLDEQGLLRALEVVLFPGTLVKVTGLGERNIVQIQTSEYPGEKLYTHKKFLEDAQNAKPRKKVCPPLEVILKKLNDWPKTKYLWGGNFRKGVPRLAELFPIPEKADKASKKIWTLRGVDCTGLTWEVTNGYLPRNSGDLLRFGEPISILDQSDEEIAKCLLPGDLIVWRGHVLFVEGNTVIESRLPEGVIRTDLLKRLEEIRKSGRTPVDDPTIPHKTPVYVVRRWHPDVLTPPT